MPVRPTFPELKLRVAVGVLIGNPGSLSLTQAVGIGCF